MLCDSDGVCWVFFCDVLIETRYQGTSETSRYASNEMSKFDFLSNIIFKVRRVTWDCP